jgi:predicted permease
VLLIASVNAASLFLARGESRRAEIAVRTALGAGRGRVAAQLFAESVFVALLAAVAGVGLAYLGTAGLARLAPADLPRLDQVGIDARVLAFGVVIAVATGMLFGIVPAVQGWRSDVRDVLAGGGRGGIGRRREGRVRRTLVVVQLSLATMLVLGSGLLLRSFGELRRVDLGFRPEGTLVLPLSPGASTVPPNQAAIAFYTQLEDRLAALPGVDAVGTALRVPLVGGHDNYSVRVEGAEAASVGEAPAPGIQWATPGYFPAMGIELRRGRLFTRADDESASPVAVVNEALARELWPGEDATGKRLRMWLDPWPWMEIVGVVSDVKHYGVAAEASTKLYIPHAQGFVSAYYSPASMSVFVHTSSGDAAALTEAARRAVGEVGPAVPIGSVRTMTEVVDAALARDRFTLLLLGLFTGLALALAAVGVYGVTAQAVVARTRELGLRMAVGAGSGRLARGVLGEGMAMAASGVGVGLIGGVALSRLLRAALYGVGPLDPWALAGTAPTLALVVALASLLPAWRAARLDPVEALRER